MTRFVLDVSTAAKWVLPGDREPLREEANELLARYQKGEIAFLVPDLFWSELGNVLWKAVRTRRVSEKSAAGSFADLRSLKLSTASTREVSDDAFSIACSTGSSFYDSVYVALAVTAGVPMVTADERLVNALGARWPVRWLGAFSL